jgi:uncharacterized protein (DUF433 family)
MLFYPAALPLSSATLSYVAGVIRRHRQKTGSCWRKLNPGRQALLVLSYLRKGETFADLAAAFGIGTATAWRYATETVALLAARAPKLRRALADATKAGHPYVVIDGTLIPVDRVAANRAHAQLRSPSERAHAQLKTWHILRKLRCCPWRAGQLAKAIQVLQAREIEG